MLDRNIIEYTANNIYGTTVTKEEFSCIRCDVMTAFTEAVYNLYRSSKLGLSNEKEFHKKAKRIFIRMVAIWDYEQSDYTELEYVNYLNSDAIQAIFSKTKEII